MTKDEIKENLRYLLSLMDEDHEERRRERTQIVKRLRELKRLNEEYEYRRQVIEKTYVFLCETAK